MRARDAGLASCHTCGLLLHLPADGHTHCPRCKSPMHLRKPDSLSTTWALLIAAMVAYLPANLALIVFIASVLVPLLKMAALLYLLISVQRKSHLRNQQRTRLYRVVELVGRWSMVDIFVVALLAALVNVGALATIEPGAGAIAFSAVVILTMFAAMNFEPRLIWDYEGEKNGDAEPAG